MRARADSAQHANVRRKLQVSPGGSLTTWEVPDDELMSKIQAGLTSRLCRRARFSGC